ncbi:MAG: 2-hydroxychromene-2-carboxylate isomerase [Sandaracinaceae bacterium]
MTDVHFWFDFSCPYAYLGSTRIEAVASENGGRVRWRPFLLGGVFVALGVPPDLTHAIAPAKQRHNACDLARWADVFGVPFRFPDRHPRRTVTALRALLAAPEDRWSPAIHGLYRAYWVEGRAVETPEVVREVLDEAGADGAACIDAAGTPALKAELRRRTDEALALGVFGAPTMFVDGEMFWGQDRLDWVGRALRSRRDGAVEPTWPP